jgi:uncharacterized protein (UPF0335 family)
MEELLEDAPREQYRVTAGELRQFVERYERLETERRDLADQMKEVMAEARARGYDVKVLKKLIALRKRDTDEVSEDKPLGCRRAASLLRVSSSEARGSQRSAFAPTKANVRGGARFPPFNARLCRIAAPRARM